jgi:(p)ppGpp synthase/HD superfamily hydrolase
MSKAEIKRQKELLALAISIASAAHVGQTDKSGAPYILHPLHVMNTIGTNNPRTMQVAVLHDVLEDTSVTLQDLVEYGFDSKVIQSVYILTHCPDEGYVKYIETVKKDYMATVVKIADLRHNSDITRLKGISGKDLDRMKKYLKAYIFLMEQDYEEEYKN